MFGYLLGWKLPNKSPCSLIIKYNVRRPTLDGIDRFVGRKALKAGLEKFGIGLTSDVAEELIRAMGGKNADSFTADDLALFTQRGVNGGQVRPPSVARPAKLSPTRGESTALPMKGDEKVSSPKRAGEESLSSDLARVKRRRPKDVTPTSRWGELPCWARQASRGALQELMVQHARWDSKLIVHSRCQHIKRECTSRRSKSVPLVVPSDYGSSSIAA